MKRVRNGDGGEAGWMCREDGGQKGNRVILFNMVSALTLLSRLTSVTWDVMPQEIHAGRGREQQENTRPHWRGHLKGYLPGGSRTERQ